jgi:hypothetical protein
MRSNVRMRQKRADSSSALRRVREEKKKKEKDKKFFYTLSGRPFRQVVLVEVEA